MPVAWVRDHYKRNGYCPLTLCGIPIEARGKRYGVIVLDSLADKNLRVPNPNDGFYRLIQLMTGKLLGER